MSSQQNHPQNRPPFTFDFYHNKHHEPSEQKLFGRTVPPGHQTWQGASQLFKAILTPGLSSSRVFQLPLFSCDDFWEGVMLANHCNFLVKFLNFALKITKMPC